jgi:enediyne polyketide synthase
MTQEIAIVGMACRYPDANTPEELLENSLAQRRAFRRIPTERLARSDYYSPDPATPDRTYGQLAAVIEGFEFDRARFDISGEAFRSADMTHWLALDVCLQALTDAGFPQGQNLPLERTGVFLGNTLAGEFSRACVMRLRWPYVKRVVGEELFESVLSESGLDAARVSQFLQDLENRYKSSFPPVTGETLAGGMSNTIAGRICNHFDIKGGGYSLDGACASSLIATISACNALRSGELDVAIAGGVDLSLDPFELVGFAKAGALAADEMRVFDRRAAGFWPGEGCGFVILMRQQEALDRGRKPVALIRGWGMSSDGRGGITRPEQAGQRLALQRAYDCAGFGPDSVSYFEAHGTGTAVGDAVELSALTQALRESDANSVSVVSSVKAIIGHTKAAAGVAGLIRAAKALDAQVLPPTPGYGKPNSVLESPNSALRVLNTAEAWPADRPLRAGVSAMGFGGINAHIVLETEPNERRTGLTPAVRELVRSTQDAEVFLFQAASQTELLRKIDRVVSYSLQLSRSQLGDVANALFLEIGTGANGAARAAVVASTPEELARELEKIRTSVRDGGRTTPLRIGFLFPGQGSPVYANGGVWARRFECVENLYAGASPSSTDPKDGSEFVQKNIVLSSISALRVLERLGIRAYAGIGHSLGELSALCWAGAFDEVALLRIATLRGRIMDSLRGGPGAMASIGASAKEVESLLGNRVVMSNFNSPRQTVVSGYLEDIEAVIERARARRLPAIRLGVTHAFHSPMMREAVPRFAEHLEAETFLPIAQTVVSTVTGGRLDAGIDIRRHLAEQITNPVRFVEALDGARQEVDAWIEVGPGRVLTELARNCGATNTIALDACGDSLAGLLQAAAFAFSGNVNLDAGPLFRGRFFRHFDLDWKPRFFASPCESAQQASSSRAGAQPAPTPASVDEAGKTDTTPLAVVRRLVARRMEMPESQVQDSVRLLSDLHLSSIVVGQIVSEAFRQLDLSPPMAPTEYADAQVKEIAAAIEEQQRTGSPKVPERVPMGVDSWVRCFRLELIPSPDLKGEAAPDGAGAWEVFSAEEAGGFVTLLSESLSRISGRGIALCVPQDPDERHVALMLSAVRAAMAKRDGTKFVVIQSSGGGAALAKALYLEAPEVSCCVVNVHAFSEEVIPWIAQEVRMSRGFVEVHYDSRGRRSIPQLRVIRESPSVVSDSLTSADLILVTGGGKGIAAEAALHLGKSTGARIALLGRSDPASDTVLKANLARFESAGLIFTYAAADVTDRNQVRMAVEQIESELGKVTGIIHAAGNNVPRLLVALDEPEFQRTLAPKVAGLRNLLAAVPAEQLRLLVALGSIISHTGLRGEGDYGVANEWLRLEVLRWREAHPRCRSLILDSSLWSGTGMGQRLGRVDSLIQQGISPIPVDEGVRVIEQLIRAQEEGSVVVTGRFGAPPTISVEEIPAPFVRFLEYPRVSIRGVELVAESELSIESDPYLTDHIFEGERILPGVIGLEAMAQVAMALLETDSSPEFEDIEFKHPVVVPPEKTVTIRIAALSRKEGVCEIVLRSSETGFQLDHFRAVCRRGKAETFGIMDIPEKKMDLNPQEDLYGSLLFQSGRFKRLQDYRALRARSCVAAIRPANRTNWFWPYLPGRLVLGDAGARDAAIHCIQACIPHATLLPVGLGRLEPSLLPAGADLFVRAVERACSGDIYTYDLEIAQSDGRIVERWTGLQLRTIRDKRSASWVEATLVPHIERRLEDVAGVGNVGISVEFGVSTDQAMRTASNGQFNVSRRPDGKPETGNDLNVSASHDQGLVLAAASIHAIACDIETVSQKEVSVWRDLLGEARLDLAITIAGETGTSLEEAATRVWSAAECLTKIGAAADTPLTLDKITDDGWVVLRAGRVIVCSVAAAIRGADRILAVAASVEHQQKGDHAGLRIPAHRNL